MRKRPPARAASWGAWVLLAAALGSGAASAAPLPTPSLAPSAAPTPAQLSVSLSVLRKQARRQAADLRQLHARLDLAESADQRLQDELLALRGRVNSLESTLTTLIGAVILLGLLTVVALTALFRGAARLAELDADPDAPRGRGSPATVRRGLREVEERLRVLEEEEAFPRRARIGSLPPRNGEGAGSPRRE